MAERKDAPEPAAGDSPVAELGLGSSSRILVLAGAFVVTALGLLFVYSDGQKLLEVATSTSWRRLLAPVTATVVSYLLMAASYEGIAAAAGHGVGFVEMLRITFVSNTLNYVVATGGLSGFALRMVFFQRRGIPLPLAITISLVQGVLTNLVLLLFLIAGFWFLVTQRSLGLAALASVTLLLATFIVATVACLLMIVNRRVRRRLLRGIFGIVLWGSRRFLSAHRVPSTVGLARTQLSISRGLDFLLRSRSRMIWPTIWIVLDWFVTLGVLWLSFWCVHRTVPFGIVIVGFAIGILLSFVSVVPGGVGVVEGSMTGIFVALGVPLEEAIVAVVIFRFAFYAVPFLVSLTFFRGMLRDGRNARAVPARSGAEAAGHGGAARSRRSGSTGRAASPGARPD